MNDFINKKIVCFQKTYVQNTNDTSVPLEFFAIVVLCLGNIEQ